MHGKAVSIMSLFSFLTKKEFFPSLKEIALNALSFFKCNAQPPSIAKQSLISPFEMKLDKEGFLSGSSS